MRVLIRQAKRKKKLFTLEALINSSKEGLSGGNKMDKVGSSVGIRGRVYEKKVDSINITGLAGTKIF